MDTHIYKLPNSDVVFAFTKKGLVKNDQMFDSSITEHLPSSVLLTQNFIKVITNQGLLKITEDGLIIENKLTNLMGW